MSDNPTPAEQPINLGPLRLAKHAKVTRQPGEREFALEIDGQPFPWFVGADDGIKTEVSVERLSAITVTILVEQVEISDRMMQDRAEDLMAGHFHDGMAAQS